MAEPAVVQIEGLRYAYPHGVEALRGVSLRVGRGETLWLLGPNGAGKSTLLLHLNGLLRGQGRVEVLGQHLRHADLRALRRRVGLVFENPEDQLLMPTVRDEVALAALNAGYPTEEVRRRTAQRLRDFGLEELAGRCPQELSLGQKKRVALAAVLVTEVELLVLDDPTGGLDPWVREEMLAVLQDLPATKVVATHDLDLARRLGGQAALLWAGQVRAAGPVEEVLRELPS